MKKYHKTAEKKLAESKEEKERKDKEIEDKIIREYEAKETIFNMLSVFNSVTLAYFKLRTTVSAMISLWI